MAIALPEAKQVLVVDDEPAMRNLIARILGDEGYAVDLASSGEEARQKLLEGTYNVVCSDLQNGPLDDAYSILQGVAMGVVQSRERREAAGAASTRIVVCSGSDSLQQRSLEVLIPETAGALHAKITKPFDIDNLIDTVADASRASVSVAC